MAASRLQAEYPAPTLQGGKLDLVVDAPDGDVIELKYPRDSRSEIFAGHDDDGGDGS